MEVGYEGDRGWMDGVIVALGNRGMMVEAERKSGEPWCICNWLSFPRPFLLGPCVLLARPPVLW